MIIEPVLRLDLPDHQQRLRRTLEAVRPVLVVLDPLVRLHRLDENSAQQISGLLGFLRELQRTFDCAILVVHHASKKRRGRPGQALRGSSDLHAFGDSNAYLSRVGDRVRLEVEHRNAAPIEPFHLRLVEPGPHLALAEAEVRPAPLEDRVMTLLGTADAPLTRKVLRQRLRVNNNRLGEVLDRLAGAGGCRRTPAGWVLGESGAAEVGAGAPPDRPPPANDPDLKGHPWEPEVEPDPPNLFPPR